MYIRKTKDVFEVQWNYNYSWEVLTTEETRTEARKRLKEYNENETNVPHRIIKKREKIEGR